MSCRGSLVNSILGEAATPEPAVGMGATILMWSDRHAATIVKVTRTQIHVRRDKAIRIDKTGLSETQKWQYEPDPTAPVEVFRKTQRGYRSAGGNGLWIGERQEYYDPHF